MVVYKKLMQYPNKTVITVEGFARLRNAYKQQGYHLASPDNWRTRIWNELESVKMISGFETINGKKHSVQCKYATTTSRGCRCWCDGEYHGVGLKN